MSYKFEFSGDYNSTDVDLFHHISDWHYRYWYLLAQNIIFHFYLHFNFRVGRNFTPPLINTIRQINIGKYWPMKGAIVLLVFIDCEKKILKMVHIMQSESDWLTLIKLTNYWGLKQAPVPVHMSFSRVVVAISATLTLSCPWEWYQQLRNTYRWKMTLTLIAFQAVHK